MFDLKLQALTHEHPYVIEEMVVLDPPTVREKGVTNSRKKSCLEKKSESKKYSLSYQKEFGKLFKCFKMFFNYSVIICVMYAYKFFVGIHKVEKVIRNKQEKEKGKNLKKKEAISRNNIMGMSLEKVKFGQSHLFTMVQYSYTVCNPLSS